MTSFTSIKLLLDALYSFTYIQDKVFEWTNTIDVVKDRHFFLIMLILVLIILLRSLYDVRTKAIEVTDEAITKIRQSPKRVYNYFLGNTKSIDLEAQLNEEDEWSSPIFKTEEVLFTTPRINRRRINRRRINRQSNCEFLC